MEIRISVTRATWSLEAKNMLSLISDSSILPETWRVEFIIIYSRTSKV